MFDVAYTQTDFEQLKMYHLNSEQLLTLLKSTNFCTNARKERVIDALKGVQKSREISIFKERAEIMVSVKQLALDHKTLAGLEKLSYASSFIHCVARMKIDDEQVWASLASFVVMNHEQFNARELSNIVFAMSKIQKLKPVILNFDDVFRTLEVSFVRKFDTEPFDGQSLANAVLAYSKTQNGSATFFRALESTILQNVDMLDTQNLSNIIYSYYRSENAQTDPFLLDIRPAVMTSLHRMIPVELCQVLRAYVETGHLDAEMEVRF
jgi:hypothetical protein